MIIYMVGRKRHERAPLLPVKNPIHQVEENSLSEAGEEISLAEAAMARDIVCPMEIKEAISSERSLQRARTQLKISN